MQFSVTFFKSVIFTTYPRRQRGSLLERYDYSLRPQCPSICKDDYLTYITQSYSIILVGQRPS